jgi:hypothetical protein
MRYSTAWRHDTDPVEGAGSVGIDECLHRGSAGKHKRRLRGLASRFRDSKDEPPVKRIRIVEAGRE